MGKQIAGVIPRCDFLVYLPCAFALLYTAVKEAY